MTVSPSLLIGQSRGNTIVNPEPGMFIEPVVLADTSGNVASFTATGALTTSAVSTVTSPITYASAAQAASNTGTSFSTTGATTLAVDATVTGFTGGSSPTVTFFIQRLGNDGIWYQIWASTAVAATNTVTASIGPGMTGTGTNANNVSAVLTGTCRFGWSTTGTPTAVTFSASVVAR